MESASVRYLATLSLAALAAGCSRSNPPAPEIRIAGLTMGTTYQVKVARVDVDAARQGRLATDIERILADVNRQMSTYDSESELSRFNRSRGGRPFPVSLATAEVTRAALEIGRLTQGAFDVTVFPLVEFWGFGPRGAEASLVSDADLATARQAVGLDKLTVDLDPPALRKTDPRTQVDLSAIAPGHAVDAIAERLRQEGMENYLVEIGGEVMAHGVNARGQAWRVGIERPARSATDPQSIMAAVELRDAALATSGSYRRYREQEGKRRGHVIDPRTGRPVEHHLASVTVWATSCMRADALATAALVLGPTEGLDFLERLPDAEGFLVIRAADDQWEERMTSGFHRLLVGDRAP